MTYGLERQLVAGARSLLLLGPLGAEVGMVPGLTNRSSVRCSWALRTPLKWSPCGGFDISGDILDSSMLYCDLNFDSYHNVKSWLAECGLPIPIDASPVFRETEESGNHWGPLETSRDHGRTLGMTGDHWGLLETTRDHWRPVVIPGVTGGHWGQLGTTKYCLDFVTS